MRGLVVAPLLVATAAGVGGCRGPERGAHAAIRFEDVTERAGLARVSRTFTVAAADADGDGRIDLFVSNHQRPAALLRNQGDGGFREDGAFAAGDLHGASWLDWNGDARLDLFVALGADWGTGGEPNRLYLGSPRGLEPAAVPAALADERGRGRAGCPIDLDGDGGIDLLVMNEAPGPPHRALLRRDGALEDAARRLGLARARGTSAQAVAVDDGPPVLVTNTLAVYRRGPDGRYADVTDAIGLGGLDHVQAVAVGDHDNDGDLDLYAVRGWTEPGAAVVDGGLEFLLPLRAKGRFATRFRARGALEVTLQHGGPGRSLAERPDLLRLGAARAAVATLPWRGPADAAVLAGRPADAAGVVLWRDAAGVFTLETIGMPVAGQVRGRVTASDGIELVEALATNKRPKDLGDRLFENRGGVFRDVTARAGVGHDGLGRDALFADLDNDGDLDLFVVTGGRPGSNPPDVLYRNDGGGRFTDVTAASGAAGPPAGSGNAAVAFDYDGDGALDLFTANGFGPPLYSNGPYQLLRNRGGGGGFVEVTLAGRQPNRLALGARVRAELADGRVLLQQPRGCTSAFATSVLPLHVGLGASGTVALEVTWPTGAVSRATARAGERVRLAEPAP